MCIEGYLKMQAITNVMAGRILHTANTKGGGGDFQLIVEQSRTGLVKVTGTRIMSATA